MQNLIAVRISYLAIHFDFGLTPPALDNTGISLFNVYRDQ